MNFSMKPPPRRCYPLSANLRAVLLQKFRRFSEGHANREFHRFVPKPSTSREKVPRDGISLKIGRLRHFFLQSLSFPSVDRFVLLKTGQLGHVSM